MPLKPRDTCGTVEGSATESASLLGDTQHPAATADQDIAFSAAARDDDVPTVQVTALRGFSTAVSLGVLVFLQGEYLSISTGWK